VILNSWCSWISVHRFFFGANLVDARYFSLWTFQKLKGVGWARWSCVYVSESVGLIKSCVWVLISVLKKPAFLFFVGESVVSMTSESIFLGAVDNRIINCGSTSTDNNRRISYFSLAWICSTVQCLIVVTPGRRSVPIMRTDSMVPNISPLNIMLIMLPIAAPPLLLITANTWSPKCQSRPSITANQHIKLTFCINATAICEMESYNFRYLI